MRSNLFFYLNFAIHRNFLQQIANMTIILRLQMGGEREKSADIGTCTGRRRKKEHTNHETLFMHNLS
jgi:hypothetical protein